MDRNLLSTRNVAVVLGSVAAAGAIAYMLASKTKANNPKPENRKSQLGITFQDYWNNIEREQMGKGVYVIEGTSPTLNTTVPT
jgi:hypothetical protein